MTCIAYINIRLYIVINKKSTPKAQFFRFFGTCDHSLSLIGKRHL